MYIFLGIIFVWERSNGLLYEGDKMVVPFDEKWERMVKVQMNDQRAIRSFSHNSYATPRELRCETSRAAEISPFSSSRRGTNSPASGGSQGIGTKSLVDAEHPPKLSLWNDSTFEGTMFTNNFFYVPENSLEIIICLMLYLLPNCQIYSRPSW